MRTLKILSIENLDIPEILKEMDCEDGEQFACELTTLVEEYLDEKRKICSDLEDEYIHRAYKIADKYDVSTGDVERDFDEVIEQLK